MSDARKTILCTGGAGYIGAHCVIELVQTGKYEVIVADNLANSCEKAIEVTKDLAGGHVTFVNVDLAGPNARSELAKLRFDAVIHYAALKAVGESVEKPLEYYQNNMNALLNVLFAMKDIGCKNMVFSSSATVYKPSEELITEESPLGASNPYGQTKVMAEQILQDLYVSDKSWNIVMLRYFNPVGAHPSGRIGEAPEHPANILPIVQKVAVGKQECVNVCGNDWPTRDGTGVRDYIHVQDLADGHILALDKLLSQGTGQMLIYNLGTGTGYSVLEIIKAFEKASGKQIPYKIVGRRAGDLASVVCNPAKAEKELGFRAKRTIDDACQSAWKWQSSHPDGFRTKA